MYCPKCGSKMQEGATFCSACGAKMEGESKVIITEKAQSWSTEDILSVASIAAGALGLLLALLVSVWFGYILGGGALACALIVRKKNKNNQKALIGLIVSIVTLVCSLISHIVAIALLASLGDLMGDAFSFFMNMMN